MTRRWVFAVFMAFLIAVPSAYAQNLLAQRADAIEAQIQSIIDAKQDILAPSMVEDITDDLEKIRKDIEKSKKPAKIVADLDDVEARVKAAIETVRLGLEIFGPAIEARDDAIFANAPELAEDRYEDAQKEFGKAVSDLEKGKVDNARERAPGVVTLFRDAEFNAIRKALVEPTQLRLEETVDSDVSKYAPETLKLAGNHIAQADIILSRDRYAVNEVNAEVALAEYEVNHAIYISDVAQLVLENDAGLETRMLMIEGHIRKIADAIGHKASFDSGTEAVTDAIVKKVSQSVSGADEENEQLKTQLESQTAKMEALMASESALRDSVTQVLADVEAELAEYHAILEKRERLQAKVDEVVASYEPSQAAVTTRGQDLVIALVGLAFGEGDAGIQTDQFALLTQAAASAKLYPNNIILLRGIAPPPGTAETDMELAKQRLQAVREYLVAQGVEIADERFVLTDAPNAAVEATEEAPAEEEAGEGEVVEEATSDSSTVDAAEEVAEGEVVAPAVQEHFVELVIIDALQHD